MHSVPPSSQRATFRSEISLITGTPLNILIEAKQSGRGCAPAFGGIYSVLMNYLLSVLKYSATSSTPKKTNNQDHDPICRFQDPANPKSVIVFFHDILWDGEDQQLHQSTWMSSTEPPVLWPEAWLSTKYPEAQILSAHYDVGIWKGKNTGHMDLYKLSENLWQDILPIYPTGCPVFLVGHGLGGLVIKAIIQKMQEKRDELARTKATSKHSTDGKDLRKLESFLRSVKGILYYASPFMGTELAGSMRDSPRTSSLLDPLKVLSTEACRLNNWFATWRRDQGCYARMILAGCPTGVGFWYGHLVKEASARYDIDHCYTVSESDHFHVCKPRNVTDIRFRWLIELIDPVMLALTSGRVAPIEETDEKRLCEESVRKILREAQELEEGTGLHLKVEDVTKIRRFEDLGASLRDGLEKAHLVCTGADTLFEYWE